MIEAQVGPTEQKINFSTQNWLKNVCRERAVTVCSVHSSQQIVKKWLSCSIWFGNLQSLKWPHSMTPTINSKDKHHTDQPLLYLVETSIPCLTSIPFCGYLCYGQGTQANIHIVHVAPCFQSCIVRYDIYGIIGRLRGTSYIHLYAELVLCYHPCWCRLETQCISWVLH